MNTIFGLNMNYYYIQKQFAIYTYLKKKQTKTPKKCGTLFLESFWEDSEKEREGGKIIHIQNKQR